MKPTSKKIKTATVPATVKYNGKTYKVTEITKGALDGNTKITNATIGKNVSKVGEKAFDGASKLKTLTFKGNLKSIESNALNGCKNLKTVKVVNKGDVKLIKKVLKKSLGAEAAAKVKIKVV